MLSEKVRLRAGPLSLIYANGELRGVSLGGCELLRRVYVAVRDENWGTVPAVLSAEKVEVSADRCRISFRAEHRQGDIHFVWQGRITGDSDGTIEFTMEGAAAAAFRRSRIGFCVLHPLAECAGQPCAVTHTDGTTEESIFPELIAPHQPFRDIRALSHEVMPGLQAEVTFTGEVFETEDQRNWTDASYKTYGTPLGRPFPVRIKAGTVVSQSVTLRLRGPVPSPVAGPEDVPVHVSFPPVHVSFPPAPAVVLPRLGLGIAGDGPGLTEREIARLRSLHLDHLRVDLMLSDPDCPVRLSRAAEEARSVGASLLVALHLSANAPSELARLCALVAASKPPGSWLVYFVGEKCVSEASFQLARRALAACTPGVPVIGGTDAYFAELNRARPALTGARGVAYSINPQVHAFDDDSLMETPEAQAATVFSARHLYGDLPVWVSPITLRPRFNPDATGTGGNPDRPPADPRQKSALAAAWTVASFKHLTESGAAVLTYFETTGPRGVMEGESVFPVYEALARLGEFAGGEMLPSVSSRPRQVECLALRRGQKIGVILANLTAEVQQVRLPRAFGDEGPPEEQTLSPYAVVTTHCQVT